MKKREPGRPKGTKRAPDDVHQRVWVAVEITRWKLRDQRSGRLLSVLKACEILSRELGIVWLVGGDYRQIRSAQSRNNALTLNNVQEKEIRKDSRGYYLSKGSGRLFVIHSETHPETIRARYKEAACMVRNDPFVARFWENIVRQWTERPPLPPLYSRPSRRPWPPSSGE